MYSTFTLILLPLFFLSQEEEKAAALRSVETVNPTEGGCRLRCRTVDGCGATLTGKESIKTSLG